DIGLGDFDPQQRTVGRVERGLPQLLGVHFAKALVTLDRQALSACGEYGVEELGWAGNRHRLALGVGRRFLGSILVFARSDTWFGLRWRALLGRAQRRVPGRRRGLFFRERVELARLGRGQRRRPQ